MSKERIIRALERRNKQLQAENERLILKNIALATQLNVNSELLCKIKQALKEKE